MARGLAYLHTLSIVHCNISSRYVFLNSGLEAKISGFHSAQYVVQGEPMDKWPGVPAYMPPEAEGRVYDTSFDVFSFGVLALFTLTQESPHDIAIGERVVFGPWHDVLVTRSEVERREKYFTALSRLLKTSGENGKGESKQLLKTHSCKEKNSEMMCVRDFLLSCLWLCLVVCRVTCVSCEEQSVKRDPRELLFAPEQLLPSGSSLTVTVTIWREKSHLRPWSNRRYRRSLHLPVATGWFC